MNIERIGIGLLGCVLLASCATKDQAGFSNAATAPLNDLNLVHAEIPAVLAEAQKEPYAARSTAACETLAAEIRDLDAVLGADLDTPPTDSNPSLIERGTNEAKSAAVGMVRRTTESVVPFRSWVRKLTGAERYSKKVAAAIAAGTVRRAYLKGVRSGKDCGRDAPPAA